MAFSPISAGNDDDEDLRMIDDNDNEEDDDTKTENSDSRPPSSCQEMESCAGKDSDRNDDNRIRIAVYNLHKQVRIYHVGVLVRGREFHYGLKIGVFQCRPANRGEQLRVRHYCFGWKMDFLRHVELLWRGRPLYTNLGMAELQAVQAELRPRYSWAHYSLINHNCIDYAMEFVRRIAAVPLPELAMGNFFNWAEEIRQPLISMPLRFVCATVVWKSVAKLVESDRKKDQLQSDQSIMSAEELLKMANIIPDGEEEQI